MDMITISPLQPTAATPVMISVVWTGCIKDTGFEVVGHAFHIEYDYFDDCWAVPPGGRADLSVGVLRPGNYEVVYDVLYEGVLKVTYTDSFVVTGGAGTAFPVPASSIGAACVLAAAIILAVALARWRLTGNNPTPGRDTTSSER